VRDRTGNKPSKKRITLHIGSQKTGTSSIQRALYANRPLLLQHGITLFTTNIKGKETKKGQNSWTDFDKEGLINSTISDKLAEKLARAGDHVLFSAETLSWIFNPQQIKAFHSQLSRFFDAMHVIVYLRRQDHQAVSHNQQASKSLHNGANRFYGHEAVALPRIRDHFKYYYDYNLRVGRWADVFGDENVTVRVFERDSLHNRDAVSDFFHVLGIEFNEQQPRRKESSGYEATKVGHLMNQAGIETELRRRIWPHLDNSGKFLPTRQQAWDFYNTYRESNRRLNQRLKINDRPFLFDEDFSGYPEESTEQWTEEGANKAIKNLFLAINSTPLITREDIEALLDRAAQLYPHDLQGAIRLADFAAHYRPENERAQNLLTLYRNPTLHHRIRSHVIRLKRRLLG
jgi:hypothetical protein